MSSYFDQYVPPGAFGNETIVRANSDRASSFPRQIQLRRYGKKVDLFPYQRSIVDHICSVAQAEKFEGLVTLPTGAGKTITAVASILKYLNAAQSTQAVLWIAPQHELLRQAMTSFRDLWGHLESPGDLDLHYLRTETVVDCMERNVVYFATPSAAEKVLAGSGLFPHVIVFDEAHHVAAETFLRAWCTFVSTSNCRIALGLSATPIRNNYDEQPGLVDAFGGNLIVPRQLMPAPVAKLRDDGVLSKPVFHLIPGVRDYDRELPGKPARIIKHLVRSQLRWDALIRVITEVQGLTVVYAPNRDYGKSITKHLVYLGVAAEYIDSETSLSSRIESIDRFNAGQTMVLVNVSLLIEGVDFPSAENVVLCYPVRSPIQLAQIVGRSLRGPSVGGDEYSHIWSLDGCEEQIESAIELSGSDKAEWDRVIAV
jgi:DNA repair protein RadD